MEFLASCLHELSGPGPGGLPALLTALFLAGLAGGATHCSLMCAPFVLAQVAARGGAGGETVLARLNGAALLPYHLGRLLGYALLGAVAGGAAGLAAALGGSRAWLALPLALAALLVFAQAGARAGLVGGRLALPSLLPARLVGRLIAAPSGPRGVLLGLLLSGLPCGLLYAALAGAAAAGSALAGAMAMAAFVLGTLPALVGVGVLGGFFARQAGPWLQPAGTALLVANGLLLAVMATRMVV